MHVEQLKKELSKRGVYFEEMDTRESLVHLLEMDILLRSRKVKGSYVDYHMRRVTAYDLFVESYGNYTGPMLSDLLKQKGIKPPRKIVDRVEFVVSRIDEALKVSFREAFEKVTKALFSFKGGTAECDLTEMFHFLLDSCSFLLDNKLLNSYSLYTGTTLVSPSACVRCTTPYLLTLHYSRLFYNYPRSSDPAAS